jgi:hypothetical protein
MSKHFCCCLPVRFGVFVLSFLTLLGSAGTAFALWWILANGPQRGLVLEGGVKTGLIIAGVVWTVFALFGLFGFIGAIIRNRALVKTYSFFLWIQLLLSLAMGIFIIVAFYKDSLRSTIIDECTNRLDQLQNSSLPATSVALQTKQDLQNTCSAVFNQGRIGFIVSLCISLLINLYCCFIVHRYGAQLTEEQQFRGNSHAMGQTYAAKDAPQGYYPHTPMNNVAGRQGYYEYPYAQRDHGFGGTNH